MKIIVYTQFNKIGDSYLNQVQEQIEISKLEDKVYITIGDTLYEIPIEVFKGILSL